MFYSLSAKMDMPKPYLAHVVSLDHAMLYYDIYSSLFVAMVELYLTTIKTPEMLQQLISQS